MWCFGLFKSVFCAFSSFKFGNSPLFPAFKAAKSAKKQLQNKFQTTSSLFLLMISSASDM